MSDEKSDSSFHGEGNDFDSEPVDYFNQENVVTLRSMREKVNWDIEENLQEFLDQLDSVISDWEGQLPNLREIFTQEEIDRLLTVSATSEYTDLQAYGIGKRFVEFVARSGYKDEPKVDEDGKPLLHRTTALHDATRRGCYDLVRELFDIYNRFDVNYTDHDGLTHFHGACASGHVAVIEKFLEFGQDPDCLNAILNFISPPLHMALQWGHRKAAESLLRNGANPNLADAEGLTPLHYICRKCKGHSLLEMFFKINEELDKPVQIEVEDKKGRTPLHYALRNCGCKKQIVQLLLRNAAKNRRLNLTCNQGGSTPLQIICFETHYQDVDLAKIFFEINNEFNQPWQVNAVDEKGRTAQVWGLSSNVKMAEVLLRNGVDPNLADAFGFTPLHKICRFQSQDMVEQFFKICDEIQLTVEINARDNEGNTPLHLLMQNNYFDKMETRELLLRRGADPNSANAKGLTLLHFICQRKDDDGFVEKFFKICDNIQKTVVIDARDNEGNTPLHFLMQSDYLLEETTELLLRRGSDPNSANAKGLTPLHFICQRKNGSSFVDKFFKICDDIQLTVEIDARDNEGNTPLHFLMQSDDLLTKEITELLLRRGADPNSTNAEGLTPLHFICQREEDDCFVDKFFKICDEIQLTVEIDARDNEGNTPLHFLVQSYYFLTKETAELLLRRSADPNSANDKGLTPLHFICQTENDDGFVDKFFKIIDEIQLTVEIDARDNEGNTPLHLLMQNNYFDTMGTLELLLRRDADPNSANAKGLTPLHFICQREEDDCFVDKFFEIIDEIQLTVVIDARDNEGNTPLHFLIQNDYLLEETTELLLRRGSDPNSANAEGMTPLHFICQTENDDGFVEKFFKICDDIQKTVQVDARDKLNRSPLQLAVVHILLNGVKLLLDRGADMSSFVFPTASNFRSAFNKYPWLDYRYKLRLVSGTLAIVELLEDKGYELDRDASLTIIKVFVNYKNHIRLQIFDEFWRDGVFYHDGFDREATRIMVNPSLSLDEVVKLRPEEAEKLLTFEDYYKLARSDEFYLSHDLFRDACAEHLCEKLSRGVFRRWALDSFLKLTHYRLPILCCKMIVDHLSNKDFWSIYLANSNLSDAEKSDPLVSVLLL